MRKMRFFLCLVIAVMMSGSIGCYTQKAADLPVSSNKQIETAKEPGKVTTPPKEVSPQNEIGDDLCCQTEEILFSFQVENSPKTLSVCVSKEQPDYIVYRFGTKKEIEVEYPAEKSDSWNKFTYSYYLRGAGKANEAMDLNYLTFQKDGYEYKVYQEYTAMDNLTRVGIRVKENATGKETDIIGLRTSIKGNLITLRENGKINMS